VKFLIGITPCGAISFLSKCWGGGTTDKCIIMNSGFLKVLNSSDVMVLADRGFDIGDDVALYGTSSHKKKLAAQYAEKLNTQSFVFMLSV